MTHGLRLEDMGFAVQCCMIVGLVCSACDQEIVRPDAGTSSRRSLVATK